MVAGKFGFPAAIAGYLLWRDYAFTAKIVEHQAVLIELLRQLIAKH